MKKLTAHYLFGNTPLPDDISGEVEQIVKTIATEKTKEAALHKAYKLITTRFDSGRLKTFIRASDLFAASWQDLWNRTGFLHCTNQNYLLSLILVKSGNFTEKDIKLKWTTIWFFSPHQYLLIKTAKNTWTEVDCWASHYGVKFGAHASRLNTSVFKSDTK